MKLSTLPSMIVLALLALSGCGGSGDSAEWNAYFELFQAGQKFQGKVLHVTPSQVGDIMLHVEYEDVQGQTQRFIEMWSAQKAAGFKEGMAVDVYAMPGSAISQATGWKLKDKKII